MSNQAPRSGSSVGKQTMLKVGDTTFKCDCPQRDGRICGCNVFTKIELGYKTLYRCNACQSDYSESTHA